MTFVCLLVVAMVMAVATLGLEDFGAPSTAKLSYPVPMGKPGLWASLQALTLADAGRLIDGAPPLSDPTGMGLNDGCDDGKTNVLKDWNGYCEHFECKEQTLPVSTTGIEEINCLPVGEEVKLLHYCMDHNLTYDHPIPHLGDHRPVWPVYGEYTCMPPQRWLHSVEHGGLVMLYHPCADPKEVNRLKNIVKGCLRKHIIAGYELVPKERPLALVAWGCRFLMSQVNEVKVKKFIKEHALHGNEGNFPIDGDYNYGLIAKSVIPKGSNFKDEHLCPDI